MILACHNLNKSFGDHLIVRDGSFHVEDREKAALVGVNDLQNDRRRTASG